MPVYYLKYDYRNWGNLYHRVEAKTLHAAVQKMVKGTSIPASKVKVWKGNGLPRNRAGKV